MSFDLLDHAARLLEHEPTRCMGAGILHRRVTLDTGTDIGYGRFIALLQTRAQQFTVIPESPVACAADGWSADDLAAYGHALAAVGDSDPLIMLSERPADPTSMAAASAGEALAAVHGALIDVLHAGGADPYLRRAAAAGVRELEAVRRSLL